MGFDRYQFLFESHSCSFSFCPELFLPELVRPSVHSCVSTCHRRLCNSAERDKPKLRLILIVFNMLVFSFRHGVIIFSYRFAVIAPYVFTKRYFPFHLIILLVFSPHFVNRFP